MTKKENHIEGISASDHIHFGISDVSVVLDNDDVKQALKKKSDCHSIELQKTKKHKVSVGSPQRKKTKLSPSSSRQTKDNKQKLIESVEAEGQCLKLSMPQFDEFDYYVRRKSITLNERPDLKFKHLYFIHESNPGGCLSVHCYQDELDKLGPEEYEEFVDEFLNVVFEEDVVGQPRYVLGVVHDAAQNIPDLLEFMADRYPDLMVKRTMMGKSDIDTLKLHEFRELVHSTYCAGTYRCGPLLQVSLVGARSEECGGYFTDALDLIESNHLIKTMMPWGSRSCLEGMPREKSDDGPILWSRPGEQVIPTVDLPKTSPKKKRGINELKNLMYLPRSGESREILIEDRTKCHADQVGDILEKKTTAAVGLLKAVHAGQKYRTNRVVKEVTCFDPLNFEFLVEKLKLDLHEPPMTQCITWVDEARLNQLAREGVKFSTLRLRDNDVYFIPRNVIHQFRTVSAVTSVAWHVRLRHYHEQLPKEETLCNGKDKGLIFSKGLSKKSKKPGKNKSKDECNSTPLKCDESVNSSNGSSAQLGTIEGYKLSPQDDVAVDGTTFTTCR